MSDEKSMSIQEEEILMEQLKIYPCLYDKSEKSYKERNVNRNAWSKVAERLDFLISYKTVYTNISFLLLINSHV